MYVAGVQPVGARGLGGLQAVVAEPLPPPASARGGTELARELLPARLVMLDEAVVFLRDGTAVDHRPVELRQEHAARRYREDGDPDPDDSGDHRSGDHRTPRRRRSRR
jgi:hypothetical protein